MGKVLSDEDVDDEEVQSRWAELLAASLVSFIILAVLPHLATLPPGAYGLPTDGLGRNLEKALALLSIVIVLVTPVFIAVRVRKENLGIWTIALLLTSVVIAFYALLYNDCSDEYGSSQEVCAVDFGFTMLPTILAVLGLTLRWGAIAIMAVLGLAFPSQPAHTDPEKF